MGKIIEQKFSNVVYNQKSRKTTLMPTCQIHAQSMVSQTSSAINFPRPPLSMGDLLVMMVRCMPDALTPHHRTACIKASANR
jgi:hypothetical protein